MRRIGRLTAAAAFLLALAPQGAVAGTYDVYACHPTGQDVQGSFNPGADPGMSAYSICPAWDIASGVVTKVGSGGGHVSYRAGAYQMFHAPPGTALVSTTMTIGELRMESHWSIGVVVYTDFDVGGLVFGCPSFGPGCDVATPRFAGPFWVDLQGYPNFRLETRCFSSSGCSAAPSGKTPANRAIFSATEISVRIRDDVRPQIIGPSGDAWRDGWHRGHETLLFGSTDASGIRSNRMIVDGRLVRGDDYADAGWPAGFRCSYVRPRPCSDVGSGYMELDTTQFTDGSHEMAFDATDPAGNRTLHTYAMQIDNTAPGKALAVGVDGGEGWRRSNDFAVRWSNPSGQVAPISKAHLLLCGPSGDCSELERDGAGLTSADGLSLPRAGDYTLRLWLEDEASNRDREHASDLVHLRFDDVPPHGAFAAPDLGDPRAVVAGVADDDSGLASAVLSLKRSGSTDWNSVPSRLAGGAVTATIDDDALRAGVYDVRLQLTDHAGNGKTIDTRADGSRMQLRLPLRSASQIALSADRLRASKCKRTKRSRRRARRRCRTKRQMTTLASGRATLRGRLTSAGEPLAGVTVATREQARSGQLVRRAALQTDADGRFVYRSAPAPSRSIVFEHRGDRTVRSTSATIDLRVRARSALRVDHAMARNGGSVKFLGRLTGGYVPTGGKLVHLQAHFRGRWRTFATPRTDSDGRWSFRYRFGATRGVVRYRFRAWIPLEAAYPFEPAPSRVVAVTVRG